MTNDVHPLAKFIRLTNGDDVIADVIETEDDKGILYTLFHPLKVVYAPSEKSGYLSVAFMPWVFPRLCDQQEFVIHAEDVLMMADLAEQMNIYYWESVDEYLNKAEKVKEEKVHEETGMNDQEELDLFNDILDHLAKRTYH